MEKTEADIEINEKSKPFYHKFGGDMAVLFVHGFTDSNGNFLKQIERLKSMGISCMGIRLPGHGTSYKDIDNYTFEDLVGCAEEALDKLSKDYKNIYVIGFSLGGNIAFDLAKRHPDKVKKIVALGTPIRIKRQGLWKVVIPFVLPFYKYHKKRIPSYIKERWLANGAYEYYPLKSVMRLISYLEKNRELLPKIKTPTLIINIKKKDHIPSYSTEYIYKNLGSSEKKVVEVFGYHMEKHKNKAFRMALDFLNLGDFSIDEPKTIPDIFLRSAKDFSDKEALLCKEGSRYVSLKYRELEDEVFHLAYELRKLGVERGDNVALISKNRPEWVIADLAIMLSGGVVVPMHEVLTGSQMKSIIDEVGAKTVIISGREVVEKLSKANTENVKIISMDNLFEKGAENFESILKAKPADFAKIKNEILKDLPGEDDLATIVFTSGTTGNFSGVLLTHKNIVTNIGDMTSVIDLDEREKFLSILPLSHILERTVGYYVPLAIGGTISYIDDPLKLAEVAKEEKPTIIIAVPRLYEKIYDKIIMEAFKSPVKKALFKAALGVGEKKRLSEGESHKTAFKIFDKIVFSKVKNNFGGRIRFFVSGGAPLPQKVGEFFANMGILVLEGYGLTETSPVISCNTDVAGCNRFGTAGKILPSVKIKISKEGEILVKGPSVTKGYFNHEKNKLAFKEDGYFKTGDKGEIDKDGFLIIKGRIKEILALSTGKKVSPIKIEESLELSPYIKQAFVFGDTRKHVGAILVPELVEIAKKFTDFSDEQILESAEVREFIDSEIAELQKDFAHFEQVKKYIFVREPFTVENHMFTPTMKLRRHIIEKEYLEEIEKVYA